MPGGLKRGIGSGYYMNDIKKRLLGNSVLNIVWDPSFPGSTVGWHVLVAVVRICQS